MMSPTTPTQQTCILVLGMHRSGTSAVTGLINIFGAALPENILGANSDNAKGHFEPQRLIEINEKILVEAGISWDDWREFTYENLSPNRRFFYKSEISRIISEEYGNAKLFVLKDPRLCRLTDLYFDVFKEMNIDVKIVLPLRHPLEVAASLEKRDNTAPSIGQLYWLRYVLDAELKTRGQKRLFVNYDDIIENAPHFRDILGKVLNLPLQKLSKSKYKEINYLIDPALKHFSHGRKLDADIQFHDWTKKAYTVLQNLVKATDSDEQELAKYYTKLDSIRKDLDKNTTLFGTHFGALKNEVNKLTSDVLTLHGEVANRDDKLKSNISEYENKLEELSHLEAAKNNEVSSNLEKYESERKALLDQINELEIEKDAIIKANLQNYNAELDSLQSRVNELTNSHAEINQKNQALSSKNKQLLATEASLLKKNTLQNEEISTLAARSTELQNTQQKLLANIEALNATIQKVEAENARKIELAEHKTIVSNNKLRSVTSSKTWKVTAHLRNLIERDKKAVERNNIEIIKSSGMFEPLWYKTTYPDILKRKVDPLTHYVRFGADEGRRASPNFDTQWYLNTNPDVELSGQNPLVHYILNGKIEGRAPTPFETPTQSKTHRQLRQLLDLNSPTPLQIQHIVNIRAWADDETGLVWEMLDHDPYIVIIPTVTALPSGSYYMSWTSDAAPDYVHPIEVYLDTGNGFNEAECIRQIAGYKDGNWSILLRLEKKVSALRIDPSNCPGRLSFGKLRIENLADDKNSARIAAKLIKERVKSPKDVVNVAKKIGRSLKVGGLTQLETDLKITERIGGKGFDTTNATEYAKWIELYDKISDADRDTIRHAAQVMDNPPLISIAVPVYNPPPNLLKEAIDSVVEQLYPHWELILANDCSTDPAIKPILDEYGARDNRIKIIHRGENGHISKATNSALQIASGDWVALLDHDDKLTPDALFCVACAIKENPNGRLFYSDEDKIDLNGNRLDPYFKCDWNPDLFLSHNMITHLGVYDRKLLEEIDGFRVGVEGAQDYDLVLRCIERISPEEIIHIPHILYHWRIMPGSTAMASDEKPYAMIAGERALNEYLERNEIKANAKLIGIGYQVTYTLPSNPPLVSLIIPTRNAHKLVKQCVDSIFELTTYPRYEIILVDNGSDDPQSLSYFEELGNDPRVKVLRDDSPFNYSAINNRAVHQSNGEIIALVNNDISVISETWLDEMVSIAIQPNVGAVGAMLYYPNDTIQHAGVIMGLGGLAAHMHAEFPRGTMGYVGRAALRQTVSAVTAACLVVTRSNFENVGGLNEQDLTVAYNDVDFCLKLNAAGLRNIWTPHAELYHHESATRGYEISPEKKARFEKEKQYMLDNWSEIIAHDPAYSPNLTLDNAHFTLAFPPREKKPWQKR